jgi:hypothetical protein
LKKPLIAILLVLVLLIQLLPFEQIGKALISNQWTEEIPCAEAHEYSAAKSSLLYSDHLGIFLCARSINTTTSSWATVSFKESLPNNHASDILVPPPNCLG